MKHVQFPVKLAYVMAFQRAQGHHWTNVEFFLIEVFGPMVNYMLLCQDVELCHRSKFMEIKQNLKNSISHQTIIIHECCVHRSFQLNVVITSITSIHI